jgi:hypothetical protein
MNQHRKSDLEAKGLSFGYAAVCLAASLTITTIDGNPLSLRLALFCFSAGMPTALLAGILFQIDSSSSVRTRLQSWILHGFDWFSIAATFLGITFLLWSKSCLGGAAFFFAALISVIALFVFIGARKAEPAESTPASKPAAADTKQPAQSS